MSATYATKQDIQVIVNKAVEDIASIICDLSQQIDDRFNRLEARLDKLELRMDRLEARMDSLEFRMTTLEARMTSLEDRMTTLEGRVIALENDVKELYRITDKLRQEGELKGGWSAAKAKRLANLENWAIAASARIKVRFYPPGRDRA